MVQEEQGGKGSMWGEHRSSVQKDARGPHVYAGKPPVN